MKFFLSKEFIAGLLLVGLVGYVGFRSQQCSSGACATSSFLSVLSGGSLVGKSCPAFQGEDLQGNTIASAKFDNEVVLINFLSTTCPPCMQELPALSEIQANFKAKGLRVVGVSVDEGMAPDRVRAQLTEAGADFQIMMGNEGLVGQFASNMILPTTYVIDRDGNVRDVLVGRQTYEEFMVAVEPHL